MSENRVESINRNILECKGSSDSESDMIDAVLIETYWNVKMVAYSVQSYFPLY